MKVWRSMFVKEHPDNYPVKHADGQHRCSLTPINCLKPGAVLIFPKLFLVILGPLFDIPSATAVAAACIYIEIVEKDFVCTTGLK